MQRHGIKVLPSPVYTPVLRCNLNQSNVTASTIITKTMARIINKIHALLRALFW